MFTEAIKRYKSAAKCFKKENNTDSYACALRDIGREYARMDSLSLALSILMTENRYRKDGLALAERSFPWHSRIPLPHTALFCGAAAEK